MQPVSQVFLDALRTSHTFTHEVTITPPSGTGVTLSGKVVVDGSVTIDRTADQRRQLDLTLASRNPETGQSLFPATPSDPVAPYGSEVTVRRGLRFGDDAVELVRLGVFRVESVQRDLPGGPVTITGWDRSRQLVDERFTHRRKFAAQTAVSLISTLISEVYDGVTHPAAVIHDLSGDSTTIPKHTVDRDRWAEIVRVAQVIGCEVFADAFGEWVIQPVPDPATATPVWSVDAGETGVMVGVSDSLTREGAPSIVVAIGESVSGNTPSYVSQSPHGYDTNPLSPTYYLGAYGAVPRFYTSSHIRSQAQANRVADAQLADHQGLAKTLSFTSIVNPALEAGDAIQVVYPDNSTELHLVDSLTIPLTPTGAMTGESRAVDWQAE